MADWMEQANELVDQEVSHELAKDLLPWLAEVALPNEKAKVGFQTLFKGILNSPGSCVIRGMWLAWLMGAAWQRLADYAEKNKTK
jgi:hypothetical protein